MSPVAIIDISRNMHILMKLEHVGSSVVVGSPEEVGEEEHHRRMELGNVTHILEVVAVDGFVVEGVLVELCHDFLKDVVSSHSLKKARHL